MAVLSWSEDNSKSAAQSFVSVTQKEPVKMLKAFYIVLVKLFILQDFKEKKEMYVCICFGSFSNYFHNQ